MLPLAQNASIADVQLYVAEMEAERGLAASGIESQCLKLGEEVGELFEAVTGFDGTDSSGIAGESVDVIILLASIANRGRIRLDATSDTTTLTDLHQRAASNGLDRHAVADLCLRIGAHTGETFRAVRKLNGHPSDPRGRVVDLADPCRALLLTVAALTHGLGIDLEDAFRRKEEANNQRTWL